MWIFQKPISFSLFLDCQFVWLLALTIGILLAKGSTHVAITVKVNGNKLMTAREIEGAG